MRSHHPVVLLSVALLAGCSTVEKMRNSVHQEIAAEMQKAVTSQEAVQKLLPPVKVEPPPPRPVNEPRFDLVMSNAPAPQVFMALVAGTPYSMMMDPDLSGTISVNLKNVTVREVLKALRDLYHYDYEIDGKIIRVHSNSMQTRIFQINYLATQRLGNSNLRVSGTSHATSASNNSGSGGGSGNSTNAPSTPDGNGQAPGKSGAPSSTPAYSSDNSRVSTRSDTDIWRDLESALTALIGKEGGRSFVLNPHSGVVLVRAMPAELRKVETYLRSTQLMIERQVMLEAKIIDVTLNDEFQSGINWASFYGNGAIRRTLGVLAPGTTLQPGGAGDLVTRSVIALPGIGGSVKTGENAGFQGLTFQTPNFAAVLNFLESQGATQVLSSPRIATLNNQKAVLKVGVDDLFVTSIKANVASSALGDPVVTPEVTLASYFSGIALDVTPQIDVDGIITLHIHPMVSTVIEKTKNLNLGKAMGQITLPLASSNTSETDSIVRVRNGHIVAIGGLMRSAQNDERSGLPGTTEHELGVFFGQRGNMRTKRELVILIKPTVVDVQGQGEKDLADTQTRLQQYAPPSKD